MLNRFRRCLGADDGVTVIETMLAVMVVTVALFGLMGGLIASAQSMVDQRRRTQGIRVATEFQETRRELGFDTLKADLLAGCPANSTCAPSTKVVGGVTYTITPTVTEVDPEDPALGPQPGQATVMQVNTTVSWKIRGQTKSVNFTNMVSPIKPDLTKDIKSIKAFPNPTIVSKTGASDVNPWGQPTQDVQLTVELKGLPSLTPVSVTWIDDGGPKGPLNLTSTDSKLWKVTIPKTSIVKKIPGMDTPATDDDQDFGELEFLVQADIGGGVLLKQQQTLRLSRAVNPPIITPRKTSANPFSPTFISPSSFPLVRSGPPSTRGRNQVAVIFQAQVIGLNFADNGTTTDTVIARWFNYDNPPTGCVSAAQSLGWGAPANCFIAVPMTYVPATGYWRRDIPVNGQVFPLSANNIQIQFLATRTADGASASQAIPVTLT